MLQHVANDKQANPGAVVAGLERHGLPSESLQGTLGKARSAVLNHKPHLARSSQNATCFKRLQPDIDATRMGVPDGVLNQISENLGNPDGIGADRHGCRWRVHLKAQAFGMGRLLLISAHVVDQLTEIKSLSLRGQLTGLTSGKGQQVAQLPL